jgi:ribose 5-phosphate isomerase B
MVAERPRLAIASDHGGFELKQVLRAHLVEVGYDCVDLGPDTKTSVDYPIYAAAVARHVAVGEADRGVLVCGSGIGMSIAANKVNGVRAAVVQDVEHARLAGEHNNANVLCLGGRFTALELAASMVEAWLSTECIGDRHHRRIGRITDLENA